MLVIWRHTIRDIVYPVVNNAYHWVEIINKEGLMPKEPQWIDYFVDLICKLCVDPQRMRKCIFFESSYFLEDLEYALTEDFAYDLLT